MRKLISPSLYQPTTLLLLQNSKDLSNYSTSSKLSPMLLPSCLSPDGWVSSGDWSPCRSVEISWSVSRVRAARVCLLVYNGTRPSSPPVTHIMGRHHRAQRPVQVTWESGQDQNNWAKLGYLSYMRKFGHGQEQKMSMVMPDEPLCIH